jgi:hypothetical protein
MNAVLSLNRLYNLAISGKSLLFFGEAMSRLAAYLMGQLAVQQRPIRLIDAAQGFDPYLIARIGRHRDIDPRTLLERIHLSRAFTCHQLVTLFCETLPGISRSDPLFVLGPCALFYDEQVALSERRLLFNRVVCSMAALSKRGQGLYLFQSPLSKHARNLFLGRELGQFVQCVIQVRSGAQGIEGLLHTSHLPRRERSE